MKNFCTKQMFFVFLALTSLAGLQGCASYPPLSSESAQIYGSANNDSLLENYAPLITVQAPDFEYNQLGRAAARLDEKGDEEIYIATDTPTFYTREQTFTSVNGHSYVNLIYRFHFPYVPKGHLTAGKNGGLLIIITLDQQQRPILVTTVHSCGCYLAIVPTSYLDESAFPAKWDKQSQSVFGETLPGLLSYPLEFSNGLRPLISLRSGNHRVMDIQLGDLNMINTPVTMLPVNTLDELPLGNQQTSFFHQSGRLKGYIKGAFKPWELLLMSWWSFDLNIGRDKKLGDPAETGTVFYTSLKPWARQASNLWFFDSFLDYWGWQL